MRLLARRVSAFSPTGAGLKGAALWTGIEVGILVLGAFLAVALSVPRASGTEFIIERAASIVANLFLAVMFRRKCMRENLAPQDIGYTPLRKPAGAAWLAAGAGLLLVVAAVTGPLDTYLFPEGVKIDTDLLRRVREGGLPAAALFLPGNGLLTPIVEEYAWRGYVQTRLTQGLGVLSGVVITAVLFTAKHIIVDVSLFRLTTLLMASFALGLIRIRWGTTATTVVHMFMNLVATSVLIAQAFG